MDDQLSQSSQTLVSPVPITAPLVSHDQVSMVSTPVPTAVLAQSSTRIDTIKLSPGYQMVSGTVSQWGGLFEQFSHQFGVLFHQTPQDHIQMPADHELCAHISTMAYQDLATLPAVYQDRQLVPGLTTTGSIVYVNHQRQTAIIGYRGTVISTMGDLLSDMQIMMGVNSIDPRVSQSRWIYDQVKALFDTYQIWVCGHSLGGTLAYIVAKHRLPDLCVVFNPGSGPNSVFVQFLTDTMRHEPWTDRTTTYKVLGDIVSTCSYVGTTNLLTLPLSDPMQLHGMGAFGIS